MSEKSLKVILRNSYGYYLKRRTKITTWLLSMWVKKLVCSFFQNFPHIRATIYLFWHSRQHHPPSFEGAFYFVVNRHVQHGDTGPSRAAHGHGCRADISFCRVPNQKQRSLFSRWRDETSYFTSLAPKIFIFSFF